MLVLKGSGDCGYVFFLFNTEFVGLLPDTEMNDSLSSSVKHHPTKQPRFIQKFTYTGQAYAIERLNSAQMQKAVLRYTNNIIF